MYILTYILHLRFYLEPSLLAGRPKQKRNISFEDNFPFSIVVLTSLVMVTRTWKIEFQSRSKVYVCSKCVSTYICMYLRLRAGLIRPQISAHFSVAILKVQCISYNTTKLNHLLMTIKFAQVHYQYLCYIHDQKKANVRFLEISEL